ncbi:MAG: DUF2815 family protein [Planctomycetes bacterium]|nr:DUF2815 family protein [Planctomycetota bacterium]
MAGKSKTSDSIKCTHVVLSYPKVFKKNDDGKYTTQVFLDKDNPAHMKLAKLINKQSMEVFLAAGYDEDDFESRINEPDKRKLRKQPELKGNLYFNCSNRQRPIVLDEDNSPDIVDEDECIYGGVIANLLIKIYSYSHPKQGDGIALSLDAIRKVKDGEPLGNEGMGLDEARDMLAGDDDDDYEDDYAPPKKKKKKKKKAKAKKSRYLDDDDDDDDDY